MDASKSMSIAAAKKLYNSKQEKLVSQLKAINKSRSPIAISKSTSNMFRSRKVASTPKLDFKNLNGVISIDPKNRIAEVEAATIYRDLVDATLKHGLMPAVVPQFVTITVGGAVSGGACEASSYKYGAVHETVTEMTVLLSDGRVVTATANNQHSDLFFALPNTFGSLGYILKLKIKLVPTKPFVKLRHLHFKAPDDYFALIAEIMKTEHYQGEQVDFLDGVVFSGESLHLTVANFTNEAPYTSDYAYMNIYYKSIAERSEDYLTTRDFIWRWDTDWAWGSKVFGMQNGLLRLLLGRVMLNSFSYWELVNFDRRFKIADKLRAFKPRKLPKETMVQDVEVPIAQGAKFLDFFLKNFDLRPIWVCPIKSYKPVHFNFSGLQPGTHYINYGLWGSVTSKAASSPNYYNRLLETAAADHGGHKALYSTNFYPEGEFWGMFDKKLYDKLKVTYDPEKRLKNFYQKVCKEQQ